MNSSVSALLTVLVLLAGFSAASLTYLNVYAVKAAELRESALEAEASSELLHAYVYRDVSTNNTLLTLRNAGKVALEVTDIVLVDRAGGVVKAVKLNETLKLSPQQYRTMPFATLAGEEYRTYDDTYSSLSAAYFKTFRGRVYGSRYLAPPVVEVAAYETSRTTLTSQVTSTESLTVVETTQTLTSWTATVIIDNPSHWPIKVYTGVAYPRGAYREDVTFPSWGLLPGLQAKDPSNRIVNVTDSSVIKIPQFTMTYKKGYRQGSVSYWDPCDRRAWSDPYTPFSIWRPTPSSDYGPRFVAVNYETVSVCNGYGGRGAIPVGGQEYFFPENSLRNMDNLVQDTLTDTASVTGLTGAGSVDITFPADRYPITVRKITVKITSSSCSYSWGGYCYYWLINGGITSPVSLTISDANSRSSSVTLSQDVSIPLDNGSPLTVTYTVVSGNTVDVYVQYTYLSQPRRYYGEVSFPTTLEWHSRFYVERNYYSYYLVETSYFSTAIHKLAYVAVVDLWNTTNIVAYSTNGTLRVYADRPLGIVAVYTYDRTIERLPPPPPPPSSPPCMKSYVVGICESSDVGTQVWTNSGLGVNVPCDSPPPNSISVSFGTSNPGKCNAFVAPGAGTYSKNEVYQCSKNGNTITCNVPPGATIITDCDL